MWPVNHNSDLNSVCRIQLLTKKYMGNILQPKRSCCFQGSWCFLAPYLCWTDEVPADWTHLSLPFQCDSAPFWSALQQINAENHPISRNDTWRVICSIEPVKPNIHFCSKFWKNSEMSSMETLRIFLSIGNTANNAVLIRYRIHDFIWNDVAITAWQIWHPSSQVFKVIWWQFNATLSSQHGVGLLPQILP